MAITLKIDQVQFVEKMTKTRYRIAMQYTSLNGLKKNLPPSSHGVDDHGICLTLKQFQKAITPK